MIDLPKFKIGNLEINLIQGGMGVGISGKNLASAVAKCGGAGIIASVGLGLLKKYPGSYIEANKSALRDEIRAARKNVQRGHRRKHNVCLDGLYGLDSRSLRKKMST